MFSLQGGFIIETASGKCLTGEIDHSLSLTPCDSSNKRQRWRFRTYNNVYSQMINSKTTSDIDSSLLNTFSKYIRLARKKTKTNRVQFRQEQ